MSVGAVREIDPQVFEHYRARIWSLCYRMTSVAADADDLVQETFARALEHPPPDPARELLPWLVRVAVNASRDLLRRRKAQGYRGEWLPAPVELETLPDDTSAPEGRYSQAESLSFAFLIALEALTPAQRAVLILRDVLGYSVRETASALALGEPNVKTTHHRARAALASYERQRDAHDGAGMAQAREAAARFMIELAAGDAERLARLLAADALAINDGGGEFLAALRPIRSAEHVARFFVGVARGASVLSASVHTLNGLPALIVRTRNAKARTAEHSVHLFEVNAKGEITRIYSVLATRKLAHLASSSSS